MLVLYSYYVKNQSKWPIAKRTLSFEMDPQLIDLIKLLENVQFLTNLKLNMLVMDSLTLDLCC